MIECIFCKIVKGEIKATIVHEDGKAIAFKDLSPQAPTHILIIPKRHIGSLGEARQADVGLLGHLLFLSGQVAAQLQLNSGYRVVLNNGSRAGQSVFHIHIHLLGGRNLAWPPG